MCIRDRLGRARIGGLAVGLRAAAPGEVVVREALVVRVDLCLLYTSDAADERSSVDLGGRRIIKKKKSRTTCDDASLSSEDNHYHLIYVVITGEVMSLTHVYS